MNNLIGQKIDHFSIKKLLGKGGMGAVYLAWDENLKIDVAVKVMNQDLAHDREFQKRFMQEAQSAAQLSHSSIVKVKHVGNDRGMLYMIMDYFPLESLDKFLNSPSRKVELREILILLAQVVEALGYAHEKGILHRDVKPGNILIQELNKAEQEGDITLRAIVTDFGLAKLLYSSTQTQHGRLMGTYAYMSPEICLGKEPDGRSDLYAVGIMLYQLMTGKLPYEPSTDAEAIRMHVNTPVPFPKEVNTGLPEPIVSIITKAIEKHPASRYQNGFEFARILRETAGQLTEEDSASFSEHKTVIELPRTKLMEVSPATPPRPTQMGSDLVMPKVGEQLIIAQKGRPPRVIPLNRPFYFLGRERDSDIELPHEDVSRKHAKLERTYDGWQVTDLKSVNQTYIEDVKLIPYHPENWLPTDTLRIGPYFIHWQRKGVRNDFETIIRSQLDVERTFGKKVTHVQIMDGQIGVVLDPIHMILDLGGHGDLQIIIENLSYGTDHFMARIEGLPTEWVSFLNNKVDLNYASEGSISWAIQLPPGNQVLAGKYPYQVVIEDIHDADRKGIISGQLTVKTVESFSVTMHPHQLTSGERTTITLNNTGNIEGDFELFGSDDTNNIHFEGEHGRIKLPPGLSTYQEWRISTQKRSFIGTTQRLPFDIQARSTSGKVAKLDKPGALLVKPIIPVGLIGILVGLFAFCSIAIGVIYPTVIVPMTQRAQTAIAAEIAAVNANVVQQTQAANSTEAAQISESNTQIASQIMLAQTEIVLALTATAEADPDNDGLMTWEELQKYNTDPTILDTDDDGLWDGLEVKVYGSNPNIRDSDNDTLLDGEEVNNYGTSPTNGDTDGDNIRDDIEIANHWDALGASTNTPTPTKTYTPSPTSTSTPTPTFTNTPVTPPPAPPIVVTTPAYPPPQNTTSFQILADFTNMGSVSQASRSGSLVQDSSQPFSPPEFGDNDCYQDGSEPRAFLTFNISQIPANKLISAKLSLKLGGLTGTLDHESVFLEYVFIGNSLGSGDYSVDGTIIKQMSPSQVFNELHNVSALVGIARGSGVNSLTFRIRSSSDHDGNCEVLAVDSRDGGAVLEVVVKDN